MIFTVEETALVGEFDHSSRNAALMEMAEQLGLIEDPELKAQVKQTAEKLKSMSDEEFVRIDFTVYKEDENE